MKSANIIITGAALLVIILLSGCQLTDNSSNANVNSAEVKAESTEISDEARQQIQLAETIKKEVSLSLETKKDENELRVKVIFNNPNQAPVRSVQSWLSYNPNQLKGKSVEGDNSSFLLIAPYNNTFDEAKGLVMIGRSHPDFLTDKRLIVAEVVFESLVDSPSILDAYDYQEDLSGHTSANIIVDGKPYNILIKPKSPLKVIE